MFALPGIDGRISLTYFVQGSAHGVSLSMKYTLHRYEHNSIFSYGVIILKQFVSFLLCVTQIGFILNHTLDAKIIHVYIPPVLLLPYALLRNFPLRLLANARYSV